jgi:hypothetical protein
MDWDMNLIQIHANLELDWCKRTKPGVRGRRDVEAARKIMGIRFRVELIK